MSSEEARGYFEFLAHLGLTKHIGSMQATREIVELCHIESGTYVLDVGCGVGATPRFLVKAVGCRVVAVDLLEEMIVQARGRTKDVSDHVRLVVADARRLPFEDDLFDAVIMESLNVFFEDKLAAMREYARVTKPGGTIGMTEMTWLASPTPETAAYYKRTVYADTLEAQGWIELMEATGLEDVVGNAYPVDLPQESKGRIERYGCRGMIGVLFRTARTFLKDRGSREFLKDVTASLPQDMLSDMGYGVYAGRKPKMTHEK